MNPILPNILSPEDLQGLSLAELEQVAAEIREAICEVMEQRSAHFASNLGVVELTLALHTVFDFTYDRLVWDVGHQCYPHKLVTGRYAAFSGIRTRGGLMGYPNPAESAYDLFMTGHAGCSVSSALGLKCGDDILDAVRDAKSGGDPLDSPALIAQSAAAQRKDRHAVAVIGDGSFANGVVFEGLNHLGGLQKNMTVILNDNKMSICPRVGGFGRYLDTLRMHPIYSELKEGVKHGVDLLPLVGKPLRKVLHFMKDAVKAGLLGGMFFEELGINYLGPVDGHDIRALQKALQIARTNECPTLLHVFTRKGYGYQPAEEDPASYHAPPPLKQSKRAEKLETKGLKQTPLEISAKVPAEAVETPDCTYTEVASRAVLELMRRHENVVVITAAMCQGNMLERVREEFPQRFFDVGISESHAVVLAAGMAKSGLRPIVDIYSTFMQRAYDHLFHEISLQNLPVTLLMDRAGLVGPDGPTHHGTYDLAYVRPLPNIITAAPADIFDLREMLRYAVTEADSAVAIRYPKTKAVELDAEARRVPISGMKAEVVLRGKTNGGLVLACGVQVADALAVAAETQTDGVPDFTVVNARFVKPLDTETILPLIQRAAWVVTVEEGCRDGGFGSAVLEAVTDAGISLPAFSRLGINGFIQHATRAEQLAEVGLDVAGIAREVRRMQEATAVEQGGEPVTLKMRSR